MYCNLILQLALPEDSEDSTNLNKWRLALGATDLHLFQLGELDHGACEVQGITTTVPEGVQANEQGVVLHLPTCSGTAAFEDPWAANSFSSISGFSGYQLSALKFCGQNVFKPQVESGCVVKHPG